MITTQIFEQTTREEGRLEGIMEGRTEGKAEGKAEGIFQGKLETAKTMLKEEFNKELIIKVTGLTAEEIERI